MENFKFHGRIAKVRGLETLPILQAKIDEVEAYLPRNYNTLVLADGLYIIGVDRDGWTLDEYVIPRLASGLIFADEVTPS